MTNLSFLFLGANTPWTYGLAEALAQSHPTQAVQFYDWQTHRAFKPNWSQRHPPKFLNRTIEVLPSGYAGRLEWIFRGYIRSWVKNWCRQLQRQSGQSPWIIAPEPYLYPWVTDIPHTRLIYFNVDDYVLYRPDRKEQILVQERQLMKETELTLCSAQFQVKALKARYPEQAAQIYHFPHGLVESCLNPNPQQSVEPMTVGYVGTLGDRLDWKLIDQVIQACPDITFIFVGGLDEQSMINQGNWQATRQAVLSLPNVRHIGKVPADQVTTYYWSFAINWIPYLVNHPFNQASCPTKIMDGIASGRPILSTDIPECRLYPDWITIFDSVEDAIILIYEQFMLLEIPQSKEHSSKQLGFAQENTWQVRAQTLAQLLS